jgi:hypothetical protein
MNTQVDRVSLRSLTGVLHTTFNGGIVQEKQAKQQEEMRRQQIKQAEMERQRKKEENSG